MKTKDKETPEQKLEKLRNQIMQEIAIWMHENEYGCSDPFWPDGCNMNLTRNHILYYRKEIEELCQKYSLSLPGEYYYPAPPKVPNGYMASLKQKERVQRLRADWDDITTKKVHYDPDNAQMEIFDC